MQHQEQPTATHGLFRGMAFALPVSLVFWGLLWLALQ